MKLIPQPGHVLIERLVPAEAATGVFLPSSNGRLEDRSGRVVAIGDPGLVWSKTIKAFVPRPFDVEVGQYVVFKERTAEVFSIKGQTYFSVASEDLVLSAPDEESFRELSLSAQ
jgi:co-chaperonin GroES (HSP10)